MHEHFHQLGLQDFGKNVHPGFECILLPNSNGFNNLRTSQCSNNCGRLAPLGDPS